MKLPSHIEKELSRMEKTFMQGATQEDLIKELIKRRRKQVLVHSCLYYRFNHTEVSDHVYDQFAKDLQFLQKTFPELAKEVEYHAYFENFIETTSGFDLPIHLPEIVEEARMLKKASEWMKKKQI